MPNRSRKRLWVTPSTWVYFLVHALLIVLGYVTVHANPIGIAGAVGSSIIAAGITGLVVFVYVRFAQDAADRLQMIAEFGIVAVFEARAARIKPEYDARIRAAKEIDVLGFGLNAFREDYADQFAEWAQRCKVRVLLIDPNFPSTEHSFATQRELEEHDHAGSIRVSVEAFLADTSTLRSSSLSSRFQIHLYRCIPALNIFRVDDEIFWGPYLIGGPSRNNPTFIVRRGGALFSKLMQHYEAVWDLSVPA